MIIPRFESPSLTEEQRAKNRIARQPFEEFLAKRHYQGPPWSMSVMSDGSTVAIHQGAEGDKWRPVLFVLQKIGGPDGFGACYQFTDEEMAEFGRRIVSAINATEKHSNG